MTYTRIYIVLTLLMLISPSWALGQSAYFKQFKEPIEEQLSQHFDREYQLKTIVEVDEFKGSTRATRYPLDDPYETLKGHVLFGAKAAIGPYWIFGLYKGGRLVWNIREPLQCSGISVYGSMDMNLNGNVEIMVDCVIFDRPNFRGYMYIYSWDGTKAEQLSKHTDTSGTEFNSIHAYEVSSFGLMDLDGDGMIEIRGLDPDNSDQWKYWSWNGEQYGHWASTPSPPDGPFYPADMAKGRVEATVEKGDTAFTYHYVVHNHLSSKRRMVEVQMDHGKQDTVGAAPKGWKFYGGGRAEYALTWLYKRANTRFMIAQGDSLAGLSVTSTALPHIYNYYLRSEHRGPNYDHPDYSVQGNMNDLRTNSFKGKTIAPGPALEGCNNIQLTDSLTSYVQQAEKLGWVTNPTFADELNSEVQQAQRALAIGDSSLASAALTRLVTRVGEGRSSLSSEGYALLFYNAKHQLSCLPEPSVIPLLPGALTISSDRASGAFSADNFSITGDNHTIDGTPASNDERDARGIFTTSSTAGEGIASRLQSYQQDNITGTGRSPDIGTGSLDFDPAVLIDSVLAHVDHTIPVNASGTYGSKEQPVVLHAQQGMQISGSISGYGILLVDGQLQVSGELNWNGLVLQRGRPGVGPTTSVSNNVSITGAMLVYNEGPFGVSLQVSNNFTLRLSRASIAKLRKKLSF